VALGLAILTALGLILEILVVEEVLFSRCEYKIRCAIDALEYAILKLRHVGCSPCQRTAERDGGTPVSRRPILFDFPA
jgi:hypothetical protein